MAYLLKNINETPCKIVLNCYISFFQLDTFRFVGFTRCHNGTQSTAGFLPAKARPCVVSGYPPCR